MLMCSRASHGLLVLCLQDNPTFKLFFLHTVKPEVGVTFIKKPTCRKQPYRMFPNVNFVLIFTSTKQPPALRQPLFLLHLGGCLTQVWLYSESTILSSHIEASCFPKDTVLSTEWSLSHFPTNEQKIKKTQIKTEINKRTKLGLQPRFKEKQAHNSRHTF